ncbi:MAG: serine/threonine-protein kinase [Dokdonella sp.]
MTDAAAERYTRAQAIVHFLLDHSHAERLHLLDDACAGDDALRREVEWLMESVESPGVDEGAAADVLDRSFEAIGKAALGDARLQPAAPGSYRLIERVGEGGMGQVWLAEREQGAVRQRVALKMLHGAGMGTQGALAHFLEEGRILGSLNHPGIAHLIEAGFGTDGVPFIAMEYVDGESISRWCDSHAASLRARIALFIKVCAAVEYAHANLVIHRDLKPANILVDAAGDPKLLDFGIARLIDADAQGNRAVTATRAMTLAYASPEQIEGGRLGTATDIYSLGIILYELLAGARPFDHLGTDHARLNAIISGDVPSLGKTQRQVDPETRRRAMPKRIPADVNAIVMKALRREANQRYASIAEFAEDLRAFLASRPVQARRGQLGYRLRRFVWRNRWLLAAATFVLALAIGFTWRTLLAEREANAQAAISDRVAEFLVSVFAASDSNVNKNLTHELTAREVLDSGAERIDSELAGQPRIRARLLEAVGNAYRHMNDNAKGVAMLREAATIYLDPAINQPLDAARCLEAMANAMANGQFPASEAEAAARKSLMLAERLTKKGSQEIANAWMVLSLALNRGGNLLAAENAARTTYAMNEALQSSPENRLDAALGNLCIILTRRGMLTEAALSCERSNAQRLKEGRRVVLAMSMSRLAILRAAQGDFPQALSLAADALEVTRELKGEKSQFGTVFLMRQGIILDDAGRRVEAASVLQRALTDAETLDGPTSGEALEARLQFARHEARAGNFAKAITQLREIVPEMTHRFDAVDPRSLEAMTVLAQALLDSGVANLESRSLLDDAIAAWNSKDDPDAVAPAYTRLALAQWFIMNDQPQQAEPILDRLEASDSRADLQVRAAAAKLRAHRVEQHEPSGN